jgi:hypothetical protein
MNTKSNTMATRDEMISGNSESLGSGMSLKIFDLARSMGTKEDLEFINKVIGGSCANGEELPSIELVFTA